MQPEFHIHGREADDWTVVEIQGEVDVYTVPRVREYVADRIEAGRRHLIVDLTGATFMDSTGLGLLVGIQKRIRARVGDLRLVITNPDIRRIFHITGLHQVFLIYDSPEAAMS
ncbi:STAS domain-containing protein [Streptomyces carpinensis]|uniref:Anti-sigma factor antagonist n=1 Tax=Streptomyces carpinensis TaxID=66369 RepID=A0ABV1WFL0_9ACTN|nr:STAS domain-containing protein [Streptomyces carpinensis]